MADFFNAAAVTEPVTRADFIALLNVKADNAPPRIFYPPCLAWQLIEDTRRA